SSRSPDWTAYRNHRPRTQCWRPRRLDRRSPRCPDAHHSEPDATRGRANHPNQLIVETVDSISDIAEPEYEVLTRGRSFYVARPWLLAVEYARGGNVRYLCCRYGLHRSLVGVLPVYGESPGPYHLYETFLSRSHARFARDEWSPAAWVGAQAVYSTEFAIDRALDAVTAEAVLSMLLDAAGHGPGTSRVPLTALHLNPVGRAQLRALGVHDDAFFTTGANCVIDIEHATLAEYIDALGGRQRREMRREQRIFEGAGYTLSRRGLSDVWM
uniref:hypothetical protein n=1 Tax=Pseudonocardia sp. ICBG1293 TaxID=2844382 RepID=UPI001CD008DE